MVFLKNKKGIISIVSSEDWERGSPKSIVIEDSSLKEKEQLGIDMVVEEGCAISCGVSQVFDLPNNVPMKKLCAIIDASAKTELEAKELMVSLFKKVFRPICARYIMFSDNDSNTRSIIHGVLSDISETETGWATNPNSGKRIKVWTYKKTRYLKGD